MAFKRLSVIRHVALVFVVGIESFFFYKTLAVQERTVHSLNMGQRS
jgi:hypothetical protein